MKYGWRSYTFDVPAGLEDESALTFLAFDGDTVSFNVTLTRSALQGTFDAYLAEAIEDLRRSLGSYKLLGQTTRKVAGLDARVLEQTATSPDGETLAQLQAYIANGKEVLIVTATGRMGEKDRLHKAFEHIVSSLRLSPA